jgi:phosphomannomutase
MVKQMNDAPLMISISGVRGIVGHSLTADIALRWAQAFGAQCAPGPVVVGGDSRISKVMMRAAAFAGLSSAGSVIIDVGVVPTPTVALAVKHHHARGGIAITASHNPLEWNAFKFYNQDGYFLSEDEGAQLRVRVESNEHFDKMAVQIGTYQRDEEAIRRHLSAVQAIPFLNLNGLRARKFRVGLDAVCGAGGELLSTLLRELGCDVVGFHLEPTGVFPRNPEPVAENLLDVCTAMKAANVDIGFVVDPDADRLVVILDTGEFAGEEQTIVAAADVTLRYAKGPVVANCSTTRALDEVARKYGAAIYHTKVGEAHVAKKMLDVGAAMGGEGNGGVMLPAVHAARDAATGMALILQAVLESGMSAADHFAALPRYAMVKRRAEFEDPRVLRRALNRLSETAPWGNADTLDGLKWTLPDAWVQMRASNTEPIVRVIAEAERGDAARKLADDALRLLRDAAK